MSGYDTEQRPTSAFSAVGSMLNPISELKYQFTGLLAYANYRSMYKTGSLSFQPYYMLSMLTGNKIGGGTSIVEQAINKKVTGQGFLSAAFGRGLEYSPSHRIATKLGYNSSSPHWGNVTSQIQKNLSNFYARKDFTSASGNQVIELLSGVADVHYLGDDPVVQKSIARTMRTGVTISRIGAFIGPATVGLAAGQVVSAAAGLWFKGSLAAISFADAAINQMRSLELGGELGPGFRTGAAATERQRAISELQRTPLAGRRFFGSEAAIYHGLI